MYVCIVKKYLLNFILVIFLAQLNNSNTLILFFHQKVKVNVDLNKTSIFQISPLIHIHLYFIHLS